jgi:peptidoglycan/LPS O-acetylase OafA/YrhL
MPMLLGTWNKSNWARSVGKFLSEISYTLYVIHFPIVILLGSIWVGTHQHSFGATGILIFFAMCLVCLICAYLMWWLFERRTNELRLRISSRLGIK